MDEATVAAMVERARAGDSHAFADLYQHFRPRVFGLCRQMLGSAAAAEDATSEVFLRIGRNLDSYDRSRPFANWVLKIAGNCCIDQLRRSSTERRLFGTPAEEPVEPAAAAESPLEQAIATERRELLHDTMAQLPERYRRVLLLRYASEMSYDEIAKATGLARNNVAILIFRAKRELRMLVAERRRR